VTGETGPTGDDGTTGPTGTTGNTGPQSNRYFLKFSINGGVGAGGTQYMLIGEKTFSSEVGIRLPAAATLIGITYSADAADASRDYDVEVLSDPAGSPAVLGSALAISNVTAASRRDLSASIGATVLIGVRLTRTTGAGNSSFTDAVVLVEIEI
jgi:hypothetical protein